MRPPKIGIPAAGKIWSGMPSSLASMLWNWRSCCVNCFRTGCCCWRTMTAGEVLMKVGCKNWPIFCCCWTTFAGEMIESGCPGSLSGIPSSSSSTLKYWKSSAFCSAVAMERTIGTGTNAPLGTNPTVLPDSLPAMYSKYNHAFQVICLRIERGGGGSLK